jgi:hypothetical protein
VQSAIINQKVLGRGAIFMSICVFTYLHTFVSIFTTVQGGGADLKSTSNFNYSTQPSTLRNNNLPATSTDQTVIVEKIVLK